MEKQALKDWINHAYEQRTSKNPHYSLRAFARDLDLDSSQLSAILKNKKGLSLERAEKIALKLGLSENETERFLLTVQENHARSFKKRVFAKEKREQIPEQENFHYQQLTLDSYRMISEWHHAAILEYLRRPRANQSPRVIAKQFQISNIQVEESLNRLQRLEWVSKKGARFHVNTGAHASPNGVPSEAIRNHHSEILKKAETSLHFQSLDEREFSSTQLVIKREQIPEMKKFLRECWKIFCTRFASNETGDSVYEFAYQLFELGKIDLQKETTPQGEKKK